MSLPARLLGANPSIQVSTLLSGSLSTPSAKQAFAVFDDYYLISESTWGSTSVTFSNIPQIYEHLEIRLSAKSTLGSTGKDTLYMYFNTYGTGLYYASQNGYNTAGGTQLATSLYSDGVLVGNAPRNSNPDNAKGASLILIPNYKSSVKKSFLAEYGSISDNTSAQGFVEVIGHWNQTSAITSITIANVDANNISSNQSRVSLYGIGGDL